MLQMLRRQTLNRRMTTDCNQNCKNTMSAGINMPHLLRDSQGRCAYCPLDLTKWIFGMPTAGSITGQTVFVDEAACMAT
eukprot:m.265750 g.265750  ORF g.265750 m.265750 type:complete len:79 (-) comp26755_c1_seq1:1645-1881(-)